MGDGVPAVGYPQHSPGQTPEEILKVDGHGQVVGRRQVVPVQRVVFHGLSPGADEGRGRVGERRKKNMGLTENGCLRCRGVRCRPSGRVVAAGRRHAVAGAPTSGYEPTAAAATSTARVFPRRSTAVRPVAERRRRRRGSRVRAPVSRGVLCSRVSARPPDQYAARRTRTRGRGDCDVPRRSARAADRGRGGAARPVGRRRAARQNFVFSSPAARAVLVAPAATDSRKTPSGPAAALPTACPGPGRAVNRQTRRPTFSFVGFHSAS